LCSLQYGVTPLHLACYYGHQREVELLLAAGANPDLQDKVRTAGTPNSLIMIRLLKPLCVP